MKCIRFRFHLCSVHFRIHTSAFELLVLFFLIFWSRFRFHICSVRCRIHTTIFQLKVFIDIIKNCVPISFPLMHSRGLNLEERFTASPFPYPQLDCFTVTLSKSISTIGWDCAIPFRLNSIVKPQSLTSCFHTTKEYSDMTVYMGRKIGS